MKSILIKIVSLLSFFLISACGSDDEDLNFNIIEFSESVDNLDRLVFVINYIDENGSQNNENDFRTLLSRTSQELNLTFFAPTNTAFRKLDQTGDGKFNQNDLNALQALYGSTQAAADALYLVLSNHIVSKKFLSSDFDNDSDVVTLAEETSMDSTIFGFDIMPITRGYSVTPSYTPSVANVESADNKVSNGIVHILDTVLLDDTTANSIGLSED